MSLKAEFKKMVTALSTEFAFPPIADIFFPPFQRGGQPGNAQFMAVSLADGAVGISFMLLPDEKMRQYNSLNPAGFKGKDPLGYALSFGSEDPVEEMIALAAINAISQHVIRATGFTVDSVTDSMGLLSASKGDRIGMVGLFSGMVNKIRDTGAELIIIEKRDHLLEKYPDLPITLDTTELGSCNKVLCTSTTILNNTLDTIVSHCSPEAFISVIGPSAGYFPDPLFAIGVDVVGGRIVIDDGQFLKRLAEKKKWGDATQRTCFRKDTYVSILQDTTSF